MSTSNVLFAGLHRGGLSIVNAFPEKTTRLYEPDWLLADPKENRATQMAGILKKKFPELNPQPFQMRAQDALALSHDDDAIVLALDTVAATTAILQARRQSQRAISQIAGRVGGPAGTRIGLQVTLTPGDQETESCALLLLRTLGQMSQAISSRVLTGPDPLTAAVLQPLRQAISRQTARHLAEKQRDPWDLTGGPMSVAFGHTVQPLLSVKGFPQDTYAQRKDRALDTAGGLPANSVIKRGLSGFMVVVAVVIPETGVIDFMKVAQNRTGKRSIAGLTSFVSPRVQQQSQSAVFTD
jgi:hypothetical protein